MTDTMKGPGMLWVTSRISQSSKDLLDEQTFLHWYDDEHILEIIETSGIQDAFRYIDVKKESALGSEASRKPFLAFYPMQDINFTQGEEFKSIRVRSDILPGSGVIYDLADIDVGYLGLLSKSGDTGKKEAAQYILVSAIEPADGTKDSEVKQFYDEQTAVVSKSPNYLRSLQFKLLYARTNAQSRALKGLPTTDEPNPEPPTWRVIHEFSGEPGEESVRSVAKGDVQQRAKQNEIVVYKLAKVHGKGKFFE